MLSAMTWIWPTFPSPGPTFSILKSRSVVWKLILSAIVLVLVSASRPTKNKGMLKRIYPVGGPLVKRDPATGKFWLASCVAKLFFPPSNIPPGVTLDASAGMLRVILSSYPNSARDRRIRWWFSYAFRYKPEMWSMIRHVHLMFTPSHRAERQATATLQDILMVLYECGVDVHSLHMRIPQGLFSLKTTGNSGLKFPNLKEVVWEGHPRGVLAPWVSLDAGASLKGLTKLVLKYSLPTRDVIRILEFCPGLIELELEVLIFGLLPPAGSGSGRVSPGESESGVKKHVQMDGLKTMKLGCEGGHALTELFCALDLPSLKKLWLDIKLTVAKPVCGISGLGLPVETMEELVIVTADGSCCEEDYRDLLARNSGLRGKYGKTAF
ncbi:hypothetical protein P691DRAFT_847652 [Macrolepiota fuliginosa MF-IS2]|uniref:Uncharacterized protein n=1 Tax=Macrolepiota fuliginosa MF-IS2 TaxID=1400762 RepID=A0A9P6BYF0_9AGAR|nr:hypothetical protein P691DRAFT_847652 [Macrolepiota fuliginosa MF-IS2]